MGVEIIPHGFLALQRRQRMNMFAHIWVIEASLIFIIQEATSLCVKENNASDETREHKVKYEARAIDEGSTGSGGKKSLDWHGRGLP